MERGVCGLCGRDSELVRGHILPKFAIKWLKSTSATGRLLSPPTGGHPVQEGPRRYIFCRECEQVLSRDERAFAQHVFYPRHATGVKWTGFSYQDWLSRFAAGLFVRAALFSTPSHDSPGTRALGRWALPAWRAFLLGKTPSSGEFAFHLVFWSYVSEASMALPPKIQFYLMRAFDMTFAETKNRREALLYAHLPGFTFWTQLVPSRPKGWRNTLIHRSGRFAQPLSQTVGAPGAMEFIFGRVDAVTHMTRGTTAQQSARREHFLRDPDRALRSASREAWEATMALRMGGHLLPEQEV